MRQVMLFIAITLLCVVDCTIKEGVLQEFHLRSTETQSYEFQLSNPHIVLYFQPSDVNEDLQDKLERKHKKSKASKSKASTSASKKRDNEDDDRLLQEDRLLSALPSPGKIDIYLTDIEQGGENTIEIDNFYSTAFYKNAINKDGVARVTVKCLQGPCQGTLTAYSEANDTELKEEEEVKLTISKSQPIRVFTITVPDKKTNTDRLVITVRSTSESLVHDHVSLDVFGDADLRSHQQGGKMFLILDGASKTTCNGCQVDVVISANSPTSKSYLYVEYSLFQHETELIQSKPRIDYLSGLGAVNLYKIKLSSKFEVFKLRVSSFMGLMPHIVANLDSRPELVKDYQFDSILSGDIKGDQLSILFRDQELDGDYLFVLLNDISGIYEIEFTRSRNDPVVMIDELYVAQLKSGTVHTYLMKAFPAPEQNGLYAQVAAYQLGGVDDPAFVLYLKQCTKSFCEGEQFTTNPAAITKVDQHESQVQLVQEREGFAYKLKPQCSKAEQDKDGYCWYGLAVLSTHATADLHYLITSSMAQGNLIIAANKPFSSEILQGDTHQMVFYYEKSAGDTAIIFSVSTPSVDFLVSTKCNPVTPACAKYSGGVDHLVTLRGDDIVEGAYYVAVEGLTTAQYSVTVYVQNRKQANTITLQEGQSYRGELHPGTKDGDIAYFQFAVHFDDKLDTSQVASTTINPDIQINVLGAKFKLAITVNTGDELPSIENFNLISLSGYLGIEPNDEDNYMREGVYNVAVQFLHHDTLEEVDASTTLPFSITYTTSRTLKYLGMNQAHYDTLLPQKTNVYFFLYHPNMVMKRHMLLSRQHLAPQGAQVNVFLGPEPHKQQDGEYQLSLKDYHSSTYALEEDTLQKLCGDNNSTDAKEQEDQICEIFVFVENASSQKVTFSLTLWDPAQPIELHEGQRQQYNLDSVAPGEKLLFTYVPVSYTNEVQIILQSYYGELSYKLLLLQRKSQDQLLSQLDTFQAAPHNTHSKTLSTSAFQRCQPDCVLHIEVTPENANITEAVDAQSKTHRTTEFDDTFSIVVSQKFLEVQSGQHIEITVSHGSPRYFIYNDVKGLVEHDDATLIITLQEFVGRGAMCISISDDEQMRMPFMAGALSCDFQVVGNRLELGSSNLTALIKDAHLSLDNNPVLLIEVSSYIDVYNTKAAGKFELFLESSRQEDKQIMLATPYKIQLAEGHNTTLTYFHYLPEDIEIKVTRQSGFGWLTITYCLDDVSNPDECHPKPVEHIQEQFLTGQSQTTFSISTLSKDFGLFCTYFLKFTTQTSISLLALVTITTPTQFVRLSQGVTFLDYLDTSDVVNLYRVPFDTKHQTEVTIKVYEGSPLLYIGHWPTLDIQEYQYGPYSVEKFKEQLNLTMEGQGFYEAILPPRQHLLDNEDKYNISTLGTNLLAAHFVEDDLYLLVRSKLRGQGTNYSVLITQGTNGASNALEDGVLTKTILSRMKPSNSFFYYHLSDNEPLLLLKAVNTNGISRPLEDFIQVEARVAPSSDHTTANLSQLQIIQLTQFQTHPDQVAYKLPNVTGFYDITITNLVALANTQNPQQNLGFSKIGLEAHGSESLYDFGYNYLDMVTLDVAINSQDMFLLETNTGMQGVLQPLQANFYEMYVPQKCKLAVSLQNCNGDLRLSYTQDYGDFLAETYQSSSRSVSGLTLDTIINARVGPLYLAVHSDSPSDAAIYNIQTTLSRGDGKVSFPQGKLLLGGDGLIQSRVHVDDPDKIDVSFKPLKCIQCDIETESRSQVVYEIVWSTQELYLNTLGKCGAMQFLQQAKDDKAIYGQYATAPMMLDATTPITHEIDVEHQSVSEQIYLSVRAKVIQFQGEPVNNYVLFYQNVQVGLPKNLIYIFKHKREQFALLTTLLMLFIVTILFCICYIYKRSRSLKKVSLELELEKKMNKALQTKNEGKSEKRDEGKYGHLEEETNSDQNL